MPSRIAAPGAMKQKSPIVAPPEMIAAPIQQWSPISASCPIRAPLIQQSSPIVAYGWTFASSTISVPRVPIVEGSQQRA